MIKRIFLKLVIISFVLLNFLATPVPTFAINCSTCQSAYNAEKAICDAQLPPASIACIAGASAARAICVNGCTHDTKSPSDMLQYCKDHSDDIDCKVPATNGDFCDANRIRTAIGCIPTQPGMFIPALIKYSYAVGGGIALLLMIIGAFQMITSAGNPEAIKKGREQFIAASTGLVFILLSTLLLRIIGVDILGIPGF